MIKVNILFNRVLDHIWPLFCVDCGQEGKLLCALCQAQIKLLPVNSFPWPDSKSCLVPCYVCLDYHHKGVQKLIKIYKYQYLANLALLLGEFMSQQLSAVSPVDALVTNIPLHARKQRQRGFDQTELLAKEVATNSGLVFHPLLKRIKYTKAQARLTKTQRLRNLKNAFTALTPNDDYKNKTVILIDDVASTGSTINEAAHCLLQAGYKKILALVLARNSDLE